MSTTVTSFYTMQENLAAAMDAVAVELTRQDGRGWVASVPEHGNGVYLTCETGDQLFVHASDWRASKASVSGSYDYETTKNHRGYNERDPEVTVTFTRPAASLAADLLRRIVPQARAYGRVLDDRRVAHTSALLEKQSLLGRLAAAAGAPEPELGKDTFEMRHRNPEKRYFAGLRVYAWSGTDHLDRPYERAEVKLDNLSIEQAEQVLALVKGWFRPE